MQNKYSRRQEVCLTLFFMIFFHLNSSLAVAQVVLDENFENYNTGTINGQGNWILNNGSVVVSEDSAYVFNGIRAGKFLANSQTLLVKNTSFGGSEPGVTGVVYFDARVKILSITDKYFSLMGYDLFGGSQKKNFVFEFNPSGGSYGDLKIYDGSSKITVGHRWL